MKNIKGKFSDKIFSIFFIYTIFSITAFSQNWDINTLDKINSHASQDGDHTFKFISNSVGPLTVGTPIVLFTVGIIKKDSTLKMQSYCVAGAMVINGVLTYALKNSIQRTRPFDTYTFLEKKDKGGGYSFPSGHTSSAFALATSLSLNYPKWYIIAPAFTYAALAGYSRMYLGVHYPTDVLGGMVIGIGSAYLSWQIQKWIIKKSSYSIRNL